MFAVQETPPKAADYDKHQTHPAGIIAKAHELGLMNLRILGLTRTLAIEGGRHGITCNAIVPDIIGTEAFHMGDPAMNERIADRTVFKRPGEPQDVANAIAFLCSDLASYVTGVQLSVSGGVELFVF